MQIVPVRGARTAAGGRPRRRAQSWLFAVTFVALGAGSIGGVAFARAQADHDAEGRIDRAARRAATAVEAEIERHRIALSGSPALVGADGSIDPAVFVSFAEGVRAGGDVGAVVLVEPATDGYEVAAAVPDGGITGATVGDDPGRVAALEAAARTRDTVVSDVVELMSTGTPGFQVIRPVTDRTDPSSPVIGFVVLPVPLGDVVDLARAAAGPEPAVALLIDGEEVAGPRFSAREPTTPAPVRVPGAAWTVVLGRGGGADLTVAWMVAIGGLVAIVAMAALAITTGRHQRRLRRANDLLTVSEERTRAVQEVAGRLARALTAQEIVTALVAHLPTAVGARSAAIAVVGDAGHLEVLGLEEASGVERVVVPGADDTDSRVSTVLASGRAAWLRSPLDWRGDEATGVLAGDGSALALLPLTGDGVVGVLAVSYPKVRIFAEDEQRLLQTVSILAARALARGRRYDAEHRTAVAFQRAALPDDLPVVEGLSIAARYRPATRQATVGGDWYDVLVLDERRVVLVVGDVVGHGMVAAAAMGRLRTAFQAIARLSTDPGTMVAALSKQVDSIPDSFCTTVVCAVVDLHTGELAWCRAGHPPPLLLGAGGPELLDERCLPPLGVTPDPVPVVHRRWMAEGDRVVLYTDGVVERRDESIDEGFRRLSVAADALRDLEPEEFGDALVEALVPGDQADDLAVLVVRYDRTPPPVADVGALLGAVPDEPRPAVSGSS